MGAKWSGIARIRSGPGAVEKRSQIPQHSVTPSAAAEDDSNRKQNPHRLPAEWLFPLFTHWMIIPCGRSKNPRVVVHRSPH
ncbi:hypothetical protein NPIL_454521 [Nephila pilipes]|uniref:Uncharacterized protein n=1 Tax=Nephila pilipes TaxID=299642 RepID=A0A8X6PC25_NEPPI|nr:hypothetical protein NPIL_454521 [Nephila pilipes]